LSSHIKGNHDNGTLPITALSEGDIINSGALTGAEFLQGLVKRDQHMSMAVDFHSTTKDIFYTLPADYGVENPQLVEHWLGALDGQFDDFKVIQKPGNNPDLGVFKQYFADQFKAHAITYEMGDNTGRVLIKTVAKSAANTLMETLLAIAICQQVICGLYTNGKGPSGSEGVSAKKVIDAKGKIVSPSIIVH
jgi:hypothetical protein